MRNLQATLVVFLLFTAAPCFAVWPFNHHRESWYQEQWCTPDKGISEYVLPDRTRCDCLTNTHAYEIDFARNFYEAIGQSLYYSLQTGKTPGILLIIEKPKDMKYWIRLNSVVDHFGLKITTEKLENY